MYQFTINNRRKQLLAICLTSCLTYNVANALTLPDGPLSTSTPSQSIPPNVMLLMDNSGSMKNIMWHSDFSLMADYGSWGNWSTSGNTKYSDLTIDSNGYLQGTKPGTSTTYSIKIPSPHAGATAFEGNYLNYLFSFADSNNLFDTTTRKADLTTVASGIPQNSRMGAAKTVAMNIVDSHTDSQMRFGLFRFNGGNGGTKVQDCGAGNSLVSSSINDLVPDSSTPLAETYLDIIKYFRGDGAATSPIQYRCQKNFAIVVTDGYPTSDNTFPGNYAGYPLPNYDGKGGTGQVGAWDSAVHSFPDNVPHFSDGFGGNSDNSAGAHLYLDDLAKLGFDIDLKISGNDLDGVSFNAADFPKQNLIAHTVGLATASNMLDDAAAVTGGTYNTTATEAGLSSAIMAALDTISSVSTVRSISNISANSTSLTDDTRIFQATYQVLGNDWTGALTATPISESDGVFSAGTAATFSIPTVRNIYSFNGTNTVAFSDTGLSLDQKNAICTPTCTGTDTAASRISYLRGVKTNELANTNGIYRNRSSILGDIINSSPTYVGPPAYRYAEPSYQAFKTSHSERPGVVYVGANDGMLHAFNATTNEEIMAYVPNTVMGNLGALTQPSYKHKYFVDGTPTTRDVEYDSTWHTVLVTGLNKGGKAIVGMDITDPTDLTATTLKAWEFTDTNDSDLGYTFSQPAISRMRNGSNVTSWAVIFGNGYNSANGKAVLYIGNLGATGLTNIIKMDTGSGDTTTPNGLSTVAPVDIDGDNTIDVIYAGDLHGKLWKFNVSSDTRSNWTTTELFSSCASQPCSQAITVRPKVGVGPKTGTVMVYFGTGKMLEDTDPNDTSLQTFYGILDTADNTTTVSTTVLTKGDLTQQSILEQYDTFYNNDGVPESNGGGYRITSANPVNYGGTTSAVKGWFMDLQYDNVALGERVITNPILRNGRIIFTTNYYTTHNEDNDSNNQGGGATTVVTPSSPVTPVVNTALCTAANSVEVEGEGWIMELDALTGSRLAYSPFDTNNNATIDGTDLVTDSSGALVAVSGKKIDSNIGEPLILTYGDKEVVITARSKSDEDEDENGNGSTTSSVNGSKNIDLGHPGQGYGRQGWIQIK